MSTTSSRLLAPLALAALLGTFTACESGTGGDGERFEARFLSLDGGLAQPYFFNSSPAPRGRIVLTGDTARFRPYAYRCTGVRVAGRVDIDRTTCDIIPTPSAVRWSSNNPAVAEVDASSGFARATGVGTVTIRAQANGYVSEPASVGFESNEISATRTFEVRQVQRIVVSADSATRQGCGQGVCPVRVDVDLGTHSIRMLPGDVFHFSVKKVIDTDGNDVLQEIDIRKPRFSWITSGPGVTVTDSMASYEGRSVATASGKYVIAVSAGGRSAVLSAEVGELASVRVVNVAPAASFANRRLVVAVGQTVTFDVEFLDSFGRVSTHVVQKQEVLTGAAFFSHSPVSNGTRYAMRYSITGKAVGEAGLGLTFGLDGYPSNIGIQLPVSVVQ